MTKVMINNVSVHGANASDGVVHGTLPPTAVIGFATKLKKDLGGEDIHNVRVLPILHSHEVSSRRIKHELTPKGAVTKTRRKAAPPKLVNKELKEEAICDMHLSLVIDFCDDLDLDDVETDVLEALPTRLAGGVVNELSLDDEHNRIDVVEIDSMSSQIFKSVKPGYVLTQPQDPEQEQYVFDENLQDLVSMLDVLSYRTPASKRGWLIPQHIGYRLLGSVESAIPRQGVRDRNKKHLFANAMIGFAELVSTNNWKLRNASEDAIESLFWEWCEFEVGETSYKTFSKFYKQHVA